MTRAGRVAMTVGSGRSLLRHTRFLFGSIALTGAAVAAYSIFVEPKLFALRRVSAPVLPAGAAPLRVLHISDLHMLPGHHRKARWVAGLAALQPDLVINTGDTMSSPDIGAAMRALGPLLDVPGGFVYGNNDFYLPTMKSPHRYFFHGSPETRVPSLPWGELADGFMQRGWHDLNNEVATLEVGGRTVFLGGTNDAHTSRDDFSQIAGAARGVGAAGAARGVGAAGAGAGGAGARGAAGVVGADSGGSDAIVRIGVTHSPEPALLDEFAADGYDIVLAGHTHGGQVRLPGVGAIVTNCGLDRSRARGISRWGAHMRLHVSAGLGTSPYMPMRLMCRPEATLLTLTPRS